MTRSLSSQNYAALQAGHLVARDFIWFVVRSRVDGSAVTVGYWSDLGSISADIINPDTGGTTTRTWLGASTLISISDIPLTTGLTVQTIQITLAQAADSVNTLLRTYDCKQGRVEIYRGLFDPLTRVMVAPAVPRFVGFIDSAPVTTPKEGESGDVTLSCTSNTQEMVRANSDTRSDASQRVRSASDNFYQDTAVVGSWQLFWGKASGVVAAPTISLGNGSLSSHFQ